MAGSGGGVFALAPPRPPPPKLPPPSPMPSAILGVSLPSLGAAGTWAAAKGVMPAGVKAPAPSTSSAVLRENFIAPTLYQEADHRHHPPGGFLLPAIGIEALQITRRAVTGVGDLPHPG